MHPNSKFFVKIWNQSTISWRHNQTIQKIFHEKLAIIFLFRLNLKSTVYIYTEIWFLESTLPQRKNSTPFRLGIPDYRLNNRKLGGNIGYFERTFIQDFKNIGEKKYTFRVLVNSTGD